MRIYSVYDSKTKAYGRPFCFKTDGELVRMFKEMLEPGREPNNFSKYPADFTVTHVGDWNEDSGVITPSSLSIVFNLQELVAPTETPQLSAVN